jgi:large subunit ribosomal protein L9
MEVILNIDIDKIGRAGNVIKVKDGFARNFLFPRHMALPATSANLKKIEHEAQRIADQRQREKEKALNLSKRLNGMSITIPVAAYDEDKLYGSVSSLEIIEALKQENISELTKEAVVLDEPIKTIGVFDVMVRLHPEVSAKIKVWVVKK